LGTPTSCCHWLATAPPAASSDQQQEGGTTTSETMPTRSALKRRQAACQTPSLRCDLHGGAAARMHGGAHLSTTRGSTSLVEQVGDEVDQHRDASPGRR
jgi:hypothetical protein